MKKYSGDRCTNPDCKKTYVYNESENWFFTRHQLTNGTWFEINLCDKCFKKMRVEEE